MNMRNNKNENIKFYTDTCMPCKVGRITEMTTESKIREILGK